MKWQLSRTTLWIALIAIILIAGLTSQSTVFAKDPTADQIQAGMLATVKIWILGPDGKAIGTCSGTVIDPVGYILTNFHCVGHTDLYGPDDTDLNLKDGDLYNPNGVSVIGPTLDPKQAPKPTYLAQFITGNTRLDIAVIKIAALYDSKDPLPKQLPLVVIKRANTDNVRVGDFIATVGYPGVGGPLVSYLPGQVSGFDDQDADGNIDSFKTSANIAPGNSGGLGMNDRGEQIGVSTWGRSDKAANKIDRFKMVNIAEPIIQKAIQIGGVSTGGVQSIPQPPSPPTTPGTNTPSGPFSKIVFGTAVQNGKVDKPATTFPSGTTKVFGVFEYTGMKQGADWGFVWFLDGQVATGDSTGRKWKDGASGVLPVFVESKGKSLPDGNYKLGLYVGGKSVLEGTFTIGNKSTTPPKPEPPATTNTGVILKGQIVDADTKRGIANALLVVLNPGVGVAQFDQALQAGNQANVIAALGFADQNGNYQTVPDIARNQTYTVIVGNENYQRRTFENGLEIADDDPAVVSMETISLKKR